MNSEVRSHPFPNRALWVLLTVFALCLCTTAPLLAANAGLVPTPGPKNRPTDPDPRWDTSSTLRPDAILGDTTWWVGDTDPKNGNVLQFHALDVENGYLFTATGQGMQIFNLSDTSAGPLSYIYGYITGGAFPIWNYSDKDWYIKQIDAPENKDNVVALTMEEQGFAIVNTSDKVNPYVAYQREVLVYRLYAFTAGGTDYAYATGSNGNLYLFNLSAAENGMKRCTEEPPAAGCTGVYMGSIGAFGTGITSLAGAGAFVATGSANRTTGGVSIWNASTPGAPVKVLDIPGATVSVALWKVGSSYYAARIDSSGQQLSIYDVSCIATGSCGTASLVWSGLVTSTNSMQYVTASVDGAKAYLYLGADDLGFGSCVAQREFIYDVSSPSAPAELTPHLNNDIAGGYWGWYYMNCPTGFNLVGPRIGKVSGGKLYRAAMSVLDVHKIFQSGPPTANFTWSPATIYPGTPVQFTDQSSGSPTSWSWVFDSANNSASPATSAQQSPGNVTYSTQGPKTVTLLASNGLGPSAPTSLALTVLDPNPVVGGVTVSPPNPSVCQQITFTATGVTGQPPLAYAWNVTDGTTTAGGTTNPLVWSTTSSTTTGTQYTAQVTVSNGTPNPASQSVSFTLNPLVALPADGQFTPTNDAFTAGTVQFHVNAPGATAWNWDFDGDNVFNDADWTSDPVNGPNPIHSYTTIGPRQVHVKVRNCVNQIGAVSAADSINIVQITPLKALFAINALCSGGACFVDGGVAVAFLDQSTGAELWDYDWDGDGTWEDSGNTAAKPSHVYNAAGEYFPKLRVRRGASETDVFTSPNKLVVGSVVPPGIAISGPSSGNVNATLSFSASGTGSCSPSASGWTWQAAGGTVTGGSISAVTISWAGAGSKSVTATNSACPSASGSLSVQISDGGGGGGGGGGTTLGAAFTYTPAAPLAGQAVSFNGSTSTGSPTGYTWDFGDSSAFGDGVQTSHTYAQPGTYHVQLSVTKPGNCPPAPFCENTLTKTVVVGTGETPLGPAFQTSATCVSEFGLNTCTAAAGDVVTFTDQSTGSPTSWSWSFGDGGSATGPSASHVFTEAQSFAVTLTIGKGSATASTAKTFNVTGQVAVPKSVILPWIAQTRGALVQSSDLYVLNPATTPIDVTLTFRKRGTPDTNPPKATRTIQPGATLYVADALRELFNRENVAGFIGVDVDKPNVEPVITSFNTTFQSDGSEFGQTVPGLSMSSTGSAAGTGGAVQDLVGLNDNSERSAYFGVSNPGQDTLTCTLRFFDHLGNQIGTAHDLVVSRFGQRQFQIKEIRDLFGIANQDDYRVEVSTPSGQVFPYGANLRLGSTDPSFVGTGSVTAQKVYLLGALSTPGINKSIWQSDAVLANTSSEVVLTDITFTGTGVTAQPTAPVHLTLQPGETRRLSDVIGQQWSLRNTVGVITLDSNALHGVYPVVQGESYENTNPAKRFGQSMAGMTEAQAAATGASQYLVGLRQDAKNRTTLWVFNPGSVPGVYDIVYLGLDGKEIGRIAGVALLPGKIRQFAPAQHPLPAGGVQGGFTVQVQVKSGKILTAAQVVNNATNDPAYIEGATR